MQSLGTLTGATNSSAFVTTKHAKIWAHVYDTGGTFGTIKLQWRIAPTDSWATFYPDGAEASYTSDFTILFDLPGGLYWSFLGNGTTDSVPIYIDGPSYRLV